MLRHSLASACNMHCSRCRPFIPCQDLYVSTFNLADDATAACDGVSTRTLCLLVRIFGLEVCH